MDHKNFAGKLHRLTRMLTTLSEHRWSSDGYEDVKMGHLQALIPMNDQDLTNNHLAIAAGMTKQSMNRLTSELMIAGYILHSKKKSADGREKLLTLSQKGKLFMNYLNTTRYDLENKLTEVLGVSKFLELNRTLESLLTFVETRHKTLS